MADKRDSDEKSRAGVLNEESPLNGMPEVHKNIISSRYHNC